MEDNTISNRAPKKITITKGTDSTTLPVAPEKYEISDSWNNEELNINQLGLITLIGKRALKKVTISSFFPIEDYDFLVPDSTRFDDPWEYVKKLAGWRGKVLQFAISDTSSYVSWQCVIDGDFIYGEAGSGDVNYSITFKEYKAASSKRSTKDVRKLNYTTKKDDTMSKICKQKLGKSSQHKTMYKQNKKKIDNGFKKYMKGMTKAQKKKYKKKAKQNRKLPKGIKLVVNL